jgi:uncharacterized protein (DUF1330 family)
MNRPLSLGLAVLAGIALGAMAIKGPKPQNKPPTYVVVDIAEITDPEGFKAVTISAATSPAATAALGGRYIIRTATTTALDGIPPKRLVVIAFDSKEKAQDWSDSQETKKITAIRNKTTKSSSFIVEGFAN